MKSRFLIQEQLDMKKRCLESGKDLGGNPLNDTQKHDLAIQAHTLEWILNNKTTTGE